MMRLVLCSLLLACGVRPPATSTLAPSPSTPPPAPHGALPSARQLAWHERTFYAFVHFNMNTFTGVEWGHGRETPDTFAPAALDCDQWCALFAECGLTGVILTVKHHDGFCLWPSAHTEHDVAASSWRGGQGDVLRELADACRRHGLWLGVYISPWDQNHPDYGRNDAAYNDAFVAQLEELLTGYGEVAEVWWDGANGDRNDPAKHQEYDWPRFVETVRRLQPDAVIFSDDGPDVRWVGNERGVAAATQWATMFPPRHGPLVSPGDDDPPASVLNTGEEGGTRWLPAEADVSIRPGWYWTADTDERVKSVDELLAIHEASVGHNTNLLLNFPVDARGLVHENDAAALRGLAAVLRATYADDLALHRRASASTVRGGAATFDAPAVVDGDPATYWATDDGVTAGAVTVELDAPHVFDRVLLQEHVELGQRVRGFRLDVRSDGSWREVFRGTTIGHRRIARFDAVTADALRLTITDARACPTIERLSVFCAPPEVAIRPDARVFLERTTVALDASLPGCTIRYTFDGSPPDERAHVYRGPFVVTRSARVRAAAYLDGARSPREASLELVGHDAASLRPALTLRRALEPGLRVQRFEGGWQTLDQLQDREPVSESTVTAVDAAPRTRDEHVALVFRGFLDVPTDGVHEFFLTSDDGSRLFVDGDLVIDNDGLHGLQERAAAVGLRAGLHRLRVEWFNATGGLGLALEWAGPGLPRVPLAGSVLGH